MTASWKSAAVRLGMFLAVCVLGVFALYAVFGQLRFGEKTKTYKAEFLNVTGLETGDFVRIAGVEVGQVDNISIQPDTTALVEFTANSSVVLTDGNRAVIRYDDLIGGRYLSLVEGAGGTTKVNPGGTIPLARTSPAWTSTRSSSAGSGRCSRRWTPIRSMRCPAADCGLRGPGRHHRLISDADRGPDQHAGRPGSVDRGGHRQPEHGARLPWRPERTVLKAVDSLSELVKGLAARRTDIANGVAYANAAAGSVADLLAQARPPFAKTIQETNPGGGIVVADHDYFDNLINTLPDAYQALSRRGPMRLLPSTCATSSSSSTVRVVSRGT